MRDEADLFIEAKITFSQAALGAEIEIPTLSGKAKLKVPPGVQSGRFLRMRGKGLPKLRGGRNGDQMVKIQVWTPSKITEAQRELFKKLERTNGAKPPEAVGKGSLENMSENL